MIRAMIEGETDPEVLANLAQRRMPWKDPELRAAPERAAERPLTFPDAAALGVAGTLEQADRPDWNRRSSGQVILSPGWVRC